jgi:hypothetical protein
LPTHTEKNPLKTPYFIITIRRTVLAENPQKFTEDTYNSPKSVQISPKIWIYFLKITFKIGWTMG